MKIFNLYGAAIIPLMLLCFCANAQVKKQILITGKVEYLNPEGFKKYNMVWLKKGFGSKSIDSVLVKADGTFSFKLMVTKPAIYQLDILKWQNVAFWADQDINVSARGYDTAKYKSKNSGFVKVESKSAGTQLISMAMYNRYLDNKIKADLLDEGFAAQKRRNTDSAWYAYYRKQMLYRKVETLGEDRLKMMIEASVNNSASVFLLAAMDWKKEPDYVIKGLDKLLALNPGFEDAAQVKKEVVNYAAQQKLLQKGSVAPGIAYANPGGQIINLSSLKGKYVLVDFWASWCGPCRKAIPKLKELYTEYKDKGFEILSVSVDTDHSAWKRAMSEEAMPWAQVVSPDKEKTLSDFMIQGIPTLFLLDKDGKIIEKFTGYSSRLEQLLKEKVGG
ncbi:TlpA family protein disulfide reductase [Mucilaginibacter paludis]|uniref:Alkyl hydroperoxide reductase/ Thiol specific antioxidant/ Mal allergen n=1 Tax=Mucilaginibacter paludis DSM 18603 TaxID=714943 RepID=H1Y093_9SPHI|nr:TlpA disulfide reductase family protein [Mucilaginibacter paludis]EHQ28142.1 alkyl hydroperoxide reductase/ Thiol specific antioxidant/ Mal allergen [Mucilaginibacter paludis DSM 18603]